jgi:hypothetical protein
VRDSRDVGCRSSHGLRGVRGLARGRPQVPCGLREPCRGPSPGARRCAPRERRLHPLTSPSRMPPRRHGCADTHVGSARLAAHHASESGIADEQAMVPPTPYSPAVPREERAQLANRPMQLYPLPACTNQLSRKNFDDGVHTARTVRAQRDFRALPRTRISGSARAAASRLQRVRGPVVVSGPARRRRAPARSVQVAHRTAATGDPGCAAGGPPPRAGGWRWSPRGAAPRPDVPASRG